MINNGTIIKVSEYFETFQQLAAGQTLKQIDNDKETGEMQFVVTEHSEPSELEKSKVEYMTLLNWFNNEYAYKEQKYRRLIHLNKQDDDGVSATERLSELYSVAETKRARIQMLENILNQGVENG